MLWHPDKEGRPFILCHSEMHYEWGQMIGRMTTQFDNANLMEINNYELDLNVA